MIKGNRKKKEQGDVSYSKRVRDKWFCWALSFLQLMCKASLILKSNLELALSIILKERELYELKHVVMEYRSFFMFLNPSFKMTTSFTNIARTTASTSKFIY